VVDASVLAVALGDDGQDGGSARRALTGEDLAAPEIVDLEVTSVWRLTLTDERRAALALADLEELPLTRARHLPLLPRCWELRHNLTPYDAAYVALAEALDVELVTADRRLARASGLECSVRVLREEREPGRPLLVRPAVRPGSRADSRDLVRGKRWGSNPRPPGPQPVR
jgi:predicted nucleic acid-binding protein